MSDSKQEQHSPRVFGHIPGYGPGHHFEHRDHMMESGVHVTPQTGIYGDSSPGGGAFSICLSPGKYKDDVDYGNRIIFVGTGGRDKKGDQIADQSFDRHENRSLCISHKTQKPVRVVRKADKDNMWAPSSGYEYDGLYVVYSATMKRGQAGFKMCFFELRRINESGQLPSSSQGN